MKSFKMKYLISCLVLLISASAFSNNMMQSTDTTKNIIDKTKIQLKLSDGKHKFYEHNYRAAINLYKEVLVIQKNNAKANYGNAECHFALNNFDKAKEYVEKAYKLNAEVDADIHYLMGNIYHRLGDLEAAEKSINLFSKDLKENKLLDYDVELLLNQIQYH